MFLTPIDAASRSHHGRWSDAKGGFSGSRSGECRVRHHIQHITGTDITGASDRETLPRSRHKQEARDERLALSSASMP